MPVDFMSAHAHGGKLKTIAKESALLSHVSGLLNFFRPSIGTIQQHLKIMSPHLDVARHRLAVQAEVVGNGAEEDVQKLVFALKESDFVVVAQDPRPAVRTLVGVAHGPVAVAGTRSAGLRL